MPRTGISLILFLIGLVLTVLGLNACTTVTPSAIAPQNNTVSWDNRMHTLSRIQHWDLKGMLAIHDEKDNVSATLHWRQTQQAYTIDLFGPIGTYGFKLTGKPGKVALQNAKGQIFYAATPEALLAQQTGWQLPVSHLYYWVRGLPVPGIAAQKHFDAFNHLTELDQDGFHIQYLRYTVANHIDLPTKIFLNSNTLQVKIIVNQWQL
jgi:outer membrane lipoprotein LolB